MLTCKMESHDRLDLERFCSSCKVQIEKPSTSRRACSIIWKDEKSNQVIQGNCYMQQLLLTPDVQRLPGHSSPALHTTRSGILFYVTLSDLDASVRSCFQSEEGCCCIVQ
ncbi:hypothetical protein EMCRGX_G023942 [Ephydatia muelleri]